MGQQRPQPTVQSAHQHQDKGEVGETRGVADGATVTEQKLNFRILELQKSNRELTDKNRELTDDNNHLYDEVSSLDIEKRQVEENIKILKTQLRGAYENVNDLRLR